MLFFTAAVQSTQPDWVALGMMAALILLTAALAIRKRLSAGKEEVAPAAPAEAPKTTVAPAPGSAGEIKLHDVEPRTAAMLMAIVANKMGKPLNELRFISVKEIK